MKRRNWQKGIWFLFIAALALGFSSCGDDNNNSDDPVGPSYPDGALVAEKVSTPPAQNASVDALWADVEGITISTIVPTYDIEVDGHDIWWNDYEGTQIDATLKAVYTDTDLYMLITWNDNADSKLRMAWYYNQTGGEWLQMGKKYPDKFGNPPAYEDKFTMFWDMVGTPLEDNSCGPFCHGVHMATNAPDEMCDIWHWKRDRTGPVSQLDDKWLNNDQDGRHGDAGTGAYSDNKQDLVTSAGPTITAPMYWIPGRTDYHWIMQTEIDDGTARQIVDLNADGNFVDEDGTVLDKTLFGYNSNLVIPSLMGIKPATGSRGDVSAWHNWSNGMWTLKIMRARNTGATDDVQFTDVGEPHFFSIGVMNAAAIAHALPNGFAGTAHQMILGE